MLENEAIRRAYHGVEKPFTVAGNQKIITNTAIPLLIFLLKGARPQKYRDSVCQELTGDDGAPLVPHKAVIQLLPTPEDLAKVLSILTGGEFTPDELLSNAHALLGLADDDPRRERLYLAVLDAQEAQKNGDRGAVIRHELEFTAELLRRMQ
jgi:hypothetical protein